MLVPILRGGIRPRRSPSRPERRALTASNRHGLPFRSRRDVFERKEWTTLEGEQALTILDFGDLKTKELFAHAVICNGIDEKRFIVDQVVEDIIWIGHTRLLLKSDNEVSINKLVGETWA